LFSFNAWLRIRAERFHSQHRLLIRTSQCKNGLIIRQEESPRVSPEEKPHTLIGLSQVLLDNDSLEHGSGFMDIG
jgi:hypothetical protein